MLIESISEENFETKRIEGAERVRKKLKEIDIQTRKNNINFYLFFDATIWAYKVLKDKQAKPLILRGFQDKILNDKHPIIIVAGANQVGKTYSIAVKAIHHALHVNNASVLIISRSEQQAFFILDEVKLLMKAANIPFDPVIGKVENRTELHINNANGQGVSVIRCLPPTQSVYAYPATLIICDEIGFWEIDGMTQSEFFYRVIMSRINETKNWTKNCICGIEHCGHFTMGQIIGISATNGKQGIMWNLWNDKDVHQYRYNYLANPSNRFDTFMKWKENPPEGYTHDMFASVFDADFSSASGGFITLSEWNDAVREYMLPPVSSLKQVYLGGDFAGEDVISRDLDQHVLFGVQDFEEDGKKFIKVVFQKDYPKRSKKTSVYKDISLLQVAKFAYDKVGVGDSVKNDLKDKNILSEYQIESLTYSLPNKSEVYYNLKHLFEQRKIIVPNLPELKKQLIGLRFEKTPGGFIKVHHATEGLHDDWADALANACWAKRNIGASPYIGVAKKAVISLIRYDSRLNTLICPECEKIDYKGMAGYYKGHSPTGNNFEIIPCPRHKIVEITI